MCGRFTLTTPTEPVSAQFEVVDLPLLNTRYNTAPSQVVTVVGLKPDGERRWSPAPRPGGRSYEMESRAIVEAVKMAEGSCTIASSREGIVGVARRGLTPRMSSPPWEGSPRGCGRRGC